MKKKIEIRHISDILMNISLKQEEEKEQLSVTSTGTSGANTTPDGRSDSGIMAPAATLVLACNYLIGYG